MDLNHSKTILCDWIDKVQHYNLPTCYLDKFSQLCNQYGHTFELIDNALDSERRDVVACVGNKFDDRSLEFLPKIEWVHFGSIGTDKIPEELAKSRNLRISNARGIFETAVARHAFSLIFNSTVEIKRPGKNFTRIKWEKTNPIKWTNLVFLILGSGYIAQELSGILEKFNITNHILHRTKNEKNDGLLTHNDRLKFAHDKICIINLLPGNNNDDFINEKYLSAFKDIYLYVNVGRDTTENFDDIIKLMRASRIHKATWDVIRDKTVVQAVKKEFGPRVLFTPHVASFNESHWDKSAHLALFNLELFFQKRMNEMRNICYA
ncbi:hypothetical protein N9493_04255 [Amylibacter sp.]|nr:hypothetical protein [Amylibacter sp.]